MHMRQLIEKRHALKGQMQSLFDQHVDGAMPSEAQSSWDTLKGDLATLESQIEKRALLDDLERKAPGIPIGQETRIQRPELRPGEVIGLLPEQRMASLVEPAPEPLSLGRMIRGHLLGDWADAAAERRAMGEATGAAGGFFVPDSVSANVIDLVRNAAILPRAGALTIPVGAGTTTFVRVLSDPTAQWRKEGETINESDGSYEPVTVKPVSLAALVRVSVELLEDVPTFAGQIEAQISAALALELDRVGLFGKGAASEPLGLYNVTGPTDISLGANGAALADYNPWLDAIQALESINASPTATIYNPRTKRALSGLTTGISGDKTKLPPPAEFLALNRLVSTQIPGNLVQGTAANASVAFVGDFSQMAIAVRSNLVIEASRTAGDAFSKAQVLVRAILRADVAHLRPTHLARIKGITP